MIVVLGAGGIVGQNMLLRKPEDLIASFWRKGQDPLLPYCQVDLTDEEWTEEALNKYRPEAVINLAGENRVDVVESDPDAAFPINVGLPRRLRNWCNENDARFVQVSTQGVFSGEDSPYGPMDDPDPITEYGRQKVLAEQAAVGADDFIIARLTFVIGIRPFPGIGRSNPLEEMFNKTEQIQVNDRWFSPCDAKFAADALWSLALGDESGMIVHVGSPERTTRAGIAHQVGWHRQMAGSDTVSITEVSHAYFEGIAPRPADTTWDYGSLYEDKLENIVLDGMADWTRLNEKNILRRALEMNLFFKGQGITVSFDEARERLDAGFHAAHKQVAEDFREHDTDVNDDESLIDWYRKTDKYIWELSAYHLNKDFNYNGMCQGVVTHLKHENKRRVLCMGDGVGDLTLMAYEQGLEPTYHDLNGSLTAEFARFRFAINAGDIPVDLTDGWAPPATENAYDAVVAMDFFEHLVNVEEWVEATFRMLRQGGVFMARNAFGIGDAEHGDSIPMHLSINNKWTKEWDGLLERVGFERSGQGNWWRKP